jgi:hypothetical protein
MAMSIPDHIRERVEPEPARVDGPTAPTPSVTELEPAEVTPTPSQVRHISPLSQKRLEALERRRLAEQQPPPPRPAKTYTRHLGGTRQITGLSAKALLARRANHNEEEQS